MPRHYRFPLLVGFVTIALVACGHDSTGPRPSLGDARLAYLYNAQIHIMDPDGAHDTTLTDASHAVIWYAWDTAGQRVAYLDQTDRRLHILNRKTGADFAAPAFDNTSFMNWFEWSPDGSKLMVLDTGSIMLVSPSGDTPVTLASGTDRLGTPMWSPDGSKVVTSSFGQVFNNAIWIMPADGSPLLALEAPVSVAHTRWSPNGDAVVFQGTDGIWVSSTTGAMHRIITSTCAVTCDDGQGFLYPRWSPDGSKLAGVTGHSEIWIADANGTNLRKFSASSGLLPFFPFPEWSPDGSLVAFLSGTPTAFDIYTMRPDGSAKTQVSHVGRPELVRWVR